jgi:hypothetical protein
MHFSEAHRGEWIRLKQVNKIANNSSSSALHQTCRSAWTVGLAAGKKGSREAGRIGGGAADAGHQMRSARHIGSRSRVLG